jgi:hypothetical protein
MERRRRAARDAARAAGGHALVVDAMLRGLRGQGDHLVIDIAEAEPPRSRRVVDHSSKVSVSFACAPHRSVAQRKPACIAVESCVSPIRAAGR